MQEKPDDRWVTPLCGSVMYLIGPPLIGCHAEQHSMNEMEFWRKVGKNPFVIADMLYKKFGTGERVSTFKPKKVRPRKPPAERAKVPKGRKMQGRPFPKKQRKMR